MADKELLRALQQGKKLKPTPKKEKPKEKPKINEEKYYMLEDLICKEIYLSDLHENQEYKIFGTLQQCNDYQKKMEIYFDALTAIMQPEIAVNEKLQTFVDSIETNIKTKLEKEEGMVYKKADVVKALDTFDQNLHPEQIIPKYIQEYYEINAQKSELESEKKILDGEKKELENERSKLNEKKTEKEIHITNLDKIIFKTDQNPKKEKLNE